MSNHFFMLHASLHPSPPILTTPLKVVALFGCHGFIQVVWFQFTVLTDCQLQELLKEMCTQYILHIMLHMTTQHNGARNGAQCHNQLFSCTYLPQVSYKLTYIRPWIKYQENLASVDDPSFFKPSSLNLKLSCIVCMQLVLYINDTRVII